MVKCAKCKKREATKQMYRLNANGEREESSKWCEVCYSRWKGEPKPDEFTAVIIGESEVYLSSIEFLDSWMAAGYKIYGFADNPNDVEFLMYLAKREVGA